MRILKVNIIIFLLILSGCSLARYNFSNVKPEWNPPQGEEWAKIKCEQEAKSTIVLDFFNYMFGNHQIYRNCMSAYGYQ